MVKEIYKVNYDPVGWLPEELDIHDLEDVFGGCETIKEAYALCYVADVDQAIASLKKIKKAGVDEVIKALQKAKQMHGPKDSFDISIDY